jgi:hypothetical protein
MDLGCVIFSRELASPKTESVVSELADIRLAASGPAPEPTPLILNGWYHGQRRGRKSRNDWELPGAIGLPPAIHVAHRMLLLCGARS